MDVLGRSASSGRHSDPPSAPQPRGEPAKSYGDLKKRGDHSFLWHSRLVCLVTRGPSVGSNCVLELGMAVDHTGVVPADQVQLATQFGTWVKACYGSPVVLWTATDSGGGSAVTLTLQRPTTIDRVSIGEDLVPLCFEDLGVEAKHRKRGPHSDSILCRKAQCEC
jgi:hypothetical protein